MPTGKKTEKIPYLVTNLRERETLDFPALEKAAGVQFHEEHQERILDLINLYLENLYIQSEAPPDAEMKKRLDKIIKRIDRLDEVLFDSSYKGKCALSYCWPSLEMNPQQVRLILTSIKEQAKATDQTISTTPGRRANSVLRKFIRELHHIWTEAGGKRLGANNDPNTDSPSGPFLSFLQLLLKQAGQHHSSAALLKAIKAIKSDLSVEPPLLSLS